MRITDAGIVLVHLRPRASSAKKVIATVHGLKTVSSVMHGPREMPNGQQLRNQRTVFTVTELLNVASESLSTVL